MVHFDFIPLIPSWMLFAFIVMVLLLFFTRIKNLFSASGILHALFFCCLCLLSLGPSTSKITGTPPSVLFLIDSSKSMALQDRFNQAKKLLLETDLSAKNIHFRFRLFDQESKDIKETELSRIIPSGKTTSIGKGLKNGLNDFPDLVSIILLSDGANILGEDPIRWAKEAFKRHVPIHVIPIGFREDAPDGVLLVPVQRRINGKPGSKITLPVRVAVTGNAPSSVTVKLSANGNVIATKDIQLTNGMGSTFFNLELPTTKLILWEVSLKPLSGEKILSNNRVILMSESQEPSATVLVLEGSPSWEGSFVLKAIAEDPQMNMKAVRLLTPDRPVMTNLPAGTDCPLDLKTLSSINPSLLVLGKDWESLLIGKIAERKDQKYMLLSGADFPGLTRGIWLRGKIALTKEGRRFPVLHLLEGKRASGLEVQLKGGRPLATLNQSGEKLVPVIVLSKNNSVLIFSLRNAIQLDEIKFFSRLFSETLNILPVRRLLTERINYNTGENVVVEGAPNMEVEIISPGRKKQKLLTLNSSGKASFLPETAGIYKLRLKDGFEIVISVQERNPEVLIRQPNHRLLKDIAAFSGGKIIQSRQASLASVIKDLDATGKQTRSREITPVWDTISIFLCVVLLVFLVFLFGGKKA